MVKGQAEMNWKQIFINRPAFLSLLTEYEKISKDHGLDLDDTIYQNTYLPFETLADITYDGANIAPDVGSLVEFRDPSGTSVSFGIVLKGAESTFNEAFNKTTVLTIDNELTQVSLSNVTFHCLQVFNPAYVHSLDILTNRSNTDFENRSCLVNLCKRFLDDSLSLKLVLTDEDDNQLDLAYSHFSSEFNIRCVSLPEIVSSFKLNNTLFNQVNSSYYHQAVLLMSCHLCLIRDPTKWLVDSCLPSNASASITCSNNLVRGTSYMVNSTTNQEAIQAVFEAFLNSSLFAKYDRFMSDLLYQQTTLTHTRSFDNLNLHMTIWEGKKYKFIIDVMKYAVFYPHSAVVLELERLSVFKGQKVTPQAIFKLLSDLKIYDNPQNQLTDIFLSANILGKSVIKQLASSSSNDILNGDTQQASETIVTFGQLDDSFIHLRSNKTYYKDHIVYALPFNVPTYTSEIKESLLAVSLEKINSRKYLINVHVPDLVTKVDPNNNLFASILSKDNPSIKSVSCLTNSDFLPLIDKRLTSEFAFATQNLPDSNGFYKVGDTFKEDTEDVEDKRMLDLSCLTISFEYNTYEADPFANLDSKVSVSFDTLKSVQIKNLSWTELEDSLQGAANQLLSPFKLFGRRQEVTPEAMRLDETDKHNVNFLHSVLMSNFKARNHANASISDPSEHLDPSDGSNLCRKLSIEDKDTAHERVKTELSGVSFAEENRFSKAKFFVNEVEKLAGILAANYCYTNDIAVYVHQQEVLEEYEDDESTNEGDEVLVSHHNLLLPHYHAGDYFQTLLARDAKGYVSAAAHVIGNAFLGRSRVEVGPGPEWRHLALGAPYGLVNVVDGTTNYEAMANQLQILSHVQLQYQNRVSANMKHVEVVNRFGHLKQAGYNVNGPRPAAELRRLLPTIARTYELHRFLGTRHKRFWALRMLLQNSTNVNYSCVVTAVGCETSAGRLCSAICTDLGIQVEVAVLQQEVSIGTTVDCDQVLHVDFVAGQCVLKQVSRL